MTNKYLPITDHIYFNGSTFRFRFIRNGHKFSEYYPTKKMAIKAKKTYL